MKTLFALFAWLGTVAVAATVVPSDPVRYNPDTKEISTSLVFPSTTTLSGAGLPDPVITLSGQASGEVTLTNLGSGTLSLTLVPGDGAFTPNMLTFSTGKTLLVNANVGAGNGSSVTMSGALDFIGSTRGSILIRGVTSWSLLTPGAAGTSLTSNGTGADPSYTSTFPSATYTGMLTLVPSAPTSGVGSLILDFAATAKMLQTFTVSGAIAFSTTNLASGSSKTIRLIDTGAGNTISFPGSWHFVGTKPTHLTGGRRSLLSVLSFGTTDSDVEAAFSEEQ